LALLRVLYYSIMAAYSHRSLLYLPYNLWNFSSVAVRGQRICITDKRSSHIFGASPRCQAMLKSLVWSRCKLRSSGELIGGGGLGAVERQSG